MTLSFSKKNVQDRKFVEKIWKGLFDNWQIKAFTPELQQYTFDNYFAPCVSMNLVGDIDKSKLHPKIHTIREDEKNRWYPGRKIHFVINNRTKERFQFAPLLHVQDIDHIDIYWDNGEPTVYLNGRLVSSDTVSLIASNDGFDTTEDFFKYFNEDFSGKIIHWSDFQY